jgi:hypothetical protein
MGLDDRGGRVVHEHDHGGRAARTRQPLDHLGRVPHAPARAADVRAADESEHARRGEGPEIGLWIDAVTVDGFGVGRHHVVDHTHEGVVVHLVRLLVAGL